MINYIKKDDSIQLAMKNTSQITKNCNFWINNKNCNIYYINVTGISFLHLKIWLPRVLASLSHMPRLLDSFWQLLKVCHVSSHSDRHKRKLVKTRMERSHPSNSLIQANNLAIIDNINFKEKSFKFSNIYDITRDNSHR